MIDTTTVTLAIIAVLFIICKKANVKLVIIYDIGVILRNNCAVPPMRKSVKVSYLHIPIYKDRYFTQINAIMLAGKEKIQSHSYVWTGEYRLFFQNRRPGENNNDNFVKKTA